VAAQIVRPAPERSATATPFTVIEHVNLRPTLMMLTLAEPSAGWGNDTYLLQGNITLNSVCNTPPVST